MTEKNMTDEVFETLTFLANLLPAPYQMKNFLAFSVVLAQELLKPKRKYYCIALRGELTSKQLA